MTEQSTRTVDRALDLLTAVCDGHGLLLSDCARQVGLAPSTAFRLMQSLTTKGFITRDQAGVYRPGPIMMRLGAASLSQDNLVWVSRRWMRAVVESTGESVYLAIEDPTGFALYIQVIEGTHSVRHANWVGRTVPLAGSAVGRALAGEVESGTFVVEEAGVEPDVTAIASPISTNGHVIAALNLVVPSYRVKNGTTQRYGAALAESAGAISAALSEVGPDAGAEPPEAEGAAPEPGAPETSAPGAEFAGATK
ncbi:MAG: IclR family transcriptional regulator [Pauljensenia sp.]